MITKLNQIVAFYANIWRDNKNIFLKWIWWRMLPSLKIVERSQARVRGILFSGIKYHLRIEMQRLREIWLTMIFSSICLNTKSSQHCWRTLKSGRIWSRSWNLPYKAETGMNLCQARPGPSRSCYCVILKWYFQILWWYENDGSE